MRSISRPYLEEISISPHINWGMDFLQTRFARRKYKVSGKGIKVAVIDSGIQRNNRYLEEKIFTTRDFCTGKEVTKDCAGDLHGTKIAGIIAAGEGDHDCEGVAPESTLLIGKVCRDIVSCNIDHYKLSEAIHWAIDEGAGVINISIGIGYGSKVLYDAVLRAFEQNVFIVAGSGNNLSGYAIDYPAAFPETFAVGGLTRSGRYSAFTATGQQLDFLAPAEEMMSGVVSSLSFMRGSSFAAPFLTGTLALFLEEWQKRQKPMLSFNEAKKILISVAINSWENTAFGPKSGWGIVYPEKVLELLNRKDYSENKADEISGVLENHQ